MDGGGGGRKKKGVLTHGQGFWCSMAGEVFSRDVGPSAGLRKGCRERASGRPDRGVWGSWVDGGCRPQCPPTDYRTQQLEGGAKPWLVGPIRGCECGSGEGREDLVESELGVPQPRFPEKHIQDRQIPETRYLSA